MFSAFTIRSFPNHPFFNRALCCIAVLSFALSGCDGDSSGSSNGTGPVGSEPPFESASGFAQKGPFQQGATATIRPLDDDGEPAGDGVSTSVGGWGEYQFDNIDWSGPSLVEVEGFYFDESEGNYSGESISLSTVVAVDAEGNGFLGNINLVSHLLGQGIRQLMAESDDPFEDHVETALRQIRGELGLILDPRKHNLFNEGDDALHQHESGVLATLSIGASFNDDLNGLIALFNNAWENGRLTDQFLDEGWQVLNDTVAEATLSEEFDQGRQWLRDNFGDADISQQLSSVGGVTRINVCQSTTTTELVPRLCMGQPQSSSLMPGDSAVFWFRAPFDGAFRFRTRGELSVSDTIVRLAGFINDDGEIVTPQETKTRQNNGTVSTHILEEGDRVYIEVEAWSGAGFDEPEEVTLSAHRQNEGSERRPAWIFPEHAVNPYRVGDEMQHFVGSQHNSEGQNANNRSYYRFIARGFSTLRYYEHACGWEALNGHTFMSLYRTSDVATAFDGDTRVASVNMQEHYDDTGDCYVDFEVTPNAHYFVRVASTGFLQNQFQNGSMYSRPDATGSPTFSNAGRSVHFRGLSD